MTWELLQGDCIDRLAEMEEASVDAVVCDPPYGIGFMGHEWDQPGDHGPVSAGHGGSNVSYGGDPHPAMETGRYDLSLTANRRYQGWCEAWAREAFRVLKPGGHLLASCGTRTYHRLAAGVEDAGFEIRDSIMWIYGSGFPKSVRPNRDPRFCQCAEAGHGASRALGQPSADHMGTEAPSEGDVPRSAGARHSSSRPSDSPADCPPARRSGDAPARQEPADDRAFPPQRECAQARSRSPAPADDRDGGSVHSPSRAPHNDHPSSPDSDRRAESDAPDRPCIDSSSRPVSRTGSGSESLASSKSHTDEFHCEHCGRPNADGLGTALKPAHEPIVVARKPLVGTVAQNVLEFGTGALNINACRIGTESTERPNGANALGIMNDDAWEPSDGTGGSTAGRWPANVVLSHLEDCEQVGTVVVKGDQRDTGAGRRPGGFADVGSEAGDGEPNAEVYGDEAVAVWECAPGCAVAGLDRQSGRRAAGVRKGMGYHGADGDGGPAIEGDSGGASRFFYCAKTSRAERDAGLEGFEQRPSGFKNSSGRGLSSHDQYAERPAANHHPTVKPINLMRWLVRLVTPPGGLILDPFLGSGTTGCAAVLEGFEFVGIEREPEYIAIAEARIRFWAQHEGREVDDVLGLVAKSSRQAKADAERGQTTIDDLLTEAAA